MKTPLGKILVSESIISEDEFNDVLEKNNIDKKHIGIALINMGFLTQKQLEQAIIKKNNKIIKDTEIILDHYINYKNSEDQIKKNFFWKRK